MKEEDVDDNRKFVTWVMGINAVLVVAGISVVGSILWGLSRDVVKLQSGQESLVNTVNALQTQVLSSTANRYTGDQAANDRAAYLKMIDTLSLRIDAIDAHDRDQTARIGNLEYRAGVTKPGS